MDGKRRRLVAAGVIVIACLATYGQSVGFDFVNWDDDLYLLRNQAVIDPGSVPLEDHLLTPYLGYPVPVTIGTYVVEHAVFGMNPAVFHATNLVIHTLAALFLFLTLIRLGSGTVVGAFAALGFALHPACIEPVCWVSGRKEVLVALFAILSVWSLLGAMVSKDRRVRARVPAIIFVVLACLSKPSVVLLPLALLVLDRRGRPLVWLAVLGFTLTVAVLSLQFEADVGALGASWAAGDMVERVLAGAWRHAGILAQPFDLVPKYLEPPGGPGIGVLVLGGLTIATLVGLLTAASLGRHAAWFGLAFALVTYIPNSGIVPLNRGYADSYVYLPLIGLVMALGPAARGLMDMADTRLRPLTTVAALVGVLALGLTAGARAGTFRDGVALWSATYRSLPDSPQVCRNLGNAYVYGRRHEPANAVRVYEHCIATLYDRTFFLKNLAIATWMTGELDDAMKLFHEYGRARPGDRTIDKYVLDIRDKTTGEQ